MESFAVCLGVVFVFGMAFLIVLALAGGRQSGKLRAHAMGRLRDLAGSLGCSLEQGGDLLARASGAISGRRCSASMRWILDHDADKTCELTLSVQVPGLDPTAVHARWSDRLRPYRNRREGRRIEVTRDDEGILISGYGPPLAEVFSEAFPAADMAELFDSKRGSPMASWRIAFRSNGDVRLETDPECHPVGELEPKLHALLTLSGGGDSKPRGELRPRSKGVKRVTLQAGQHCAFCREGLAGVAADALKTCAACGVTLHAACLDEHGGCTTAGCRNDPRRRADPQRA